MESIIDIKRISKRTSLVLGLFAAFATLAFATVAAAAGPDGQSGKSEQGHVYLYEKDPSDAYSIVEGGAWGKLTHSTASATFDFVFNGKGLDASTDYTLIYYPDPWPGEDLICLASGTSNKAGNINLGGSVDTGDLPIPADDNAGAKIWLVLAADVDCDGDPTKMVGWNPTEYLFENNLIEYEASE